MREFDKNKIHEADLLTQPLDMINKEFNRMRGRLFALVESVLGPDQAEPVKRLIRNHTGDCWRNIKAYLPEFILENFQVKDNHKEDESEQD